MKKRAQKLIGILILIVLSGLGYALFWSKTGIAIPCVFYRITRLYCPGCGTSRMCLALLRLNIKEAFFYNSFVFCLLPFLGIYLLRQSRRYILGIKWQMAKWESYIWKVVLAGLILFGILRNLPFFSILSPE